MKKAISLYCVLLFAAALGSCTRKMACRDMQSHFMIELTPKPGSNMPDTSAVVTTCAKFTNFAGVVHSCDPQQLQQHGSVKALSLDECTPNCTNYDYKVMLLPSGKTLYVTDIQFRSREASYTGEKDFKCSNDLSMMVNGKTYSLPGYAGIQDIGETAVVAIDYSSL